MAILSRKRTSRVNARRLLADMATMYSHSVEETVVTETMANSLDANASSIRFEIDRHNSRLAVIDNGSGMTESEFDQYHDLAESTKERGKGIGFAGLGAKLAHQIAVRIRTDTRSNTYSGASEWYWKNDDLEFQSRRGTRRDNGTRVSIDLSDPDSPLLDPQQLEDAIRTHYGPLLDPILSQIYIMSAIYPAGVGISINEAPLKHAPLISETECEVFEYRDIRSANRKQIIGRAFFALAKRPQPEASRGIALSTRGKVIKRDQLGMNPKSADRIVGFAEIPALVECLTTSKQDFIATGAPGNRYRILRSQIQKEYAAWLTELGQNIDPTEAKQAPRALERELAELARALPELDYLFRHRERTAAPIPSEAGTLRAEEIQGRLLTDGGGEGHGHQEVPVTPGPDGGTSLKETPDGATPASSRRRTARRGPSVRLVTDPARQEMSWLDSDVISVNMAHPAYVKAQRENQVRYHRRVAALLAWCKGSADEDQLDLLERAMVAWGKR